MIRPLGPDVLHDRMQVAASRVACAVGAVLLSLLLPYVAAAQDADDAKPGGAAASDPTAKVSFMDFGFRYFDLPKGDHRRVYLPRAA